MKINFSVLLLALACAFVFAPSAKADDYAYGYTSMYVDSGVTVRGYHRTEVDYNTDVYYTPYVCGSLSKDGVEVTRGCGGGFASATRYTQTPYYAGSSYSALSDHSVNIEYQEEDPYNPGYYYYPDYLGYYFSGGGSQPIDWYYLASQIYNHRPDQAVYLGNTYSANCACPTPPSVSEWSGLINLFPNLERGQTCKQGPATGTYNCMAWTLDDTSQWWWLEADSNGNGQLSVSELNAFYISKGKSNIAYYGTGTGDVLHVAKKAGGQGSDCQASSKLGQSLLIAHDALQLQGGYYHNIVGGN